MQRLDIELVERKMFESRNKAKSAIENGAIFCDDKCVDKPAFLVDENTKIEVRGETLKYVSRGGLKLEKAIVEFKLNLHDKVMIDIGSSTGGFSSCALMFGVKKIVAVDVGSNQFHHSLRENSKITLYENQDFRTLDLNKIFDVNFATIDVSFISLNNLTNKLSTMPNLEEIVCLIKPQFECGATVSKKFKGVVVDKKIHKQIITNVIGYFDEINFAIQNLTYSPIKGGDGNIEYLAYFVKNKIKKLINIEKIINSAFS